MNQQLASYSMRGNRVVIHFELHDLVYSEDTIQATIDNIIRNKAEYTTEEAWRDHLAVYEGAMKFLKGNQS